MAAPREPERVQKNGVVKGFITSVPRTADIRFHRSREAMSSARGAPTPKVGKIPRNTPTANPRPMWRGSPPTRARRR